MNVRQVMSLAPVIPVIVIDDVRHAVPMAHALVEGGLRVLEITLRTPAAFDAVRAITQEVKQAVVGIGTVTDARQLDKAREAGAVFAVSPGLTPTLAHAAQSSDVQLLPGVMTPSEILVAMEFGYRAFKFFPAQPAGGVAMLKALHGPFSDIVFCPTGGITPETAEHFLALPNVLCVGGSWLTPKALMEQQDWDAINRLARASASILNQR